MILCWRMNFVCRICQILKKETASIASCKVMMQPIRVNLVRPAFPTETCFSALFSPEGNCSLVKKLWKLLWKFELNPLWGPIWVWLKIFSTRKRFHLKQKIDSIFLLPSFFAYPLMLWQLKMVASEHPNCQTATNILDHDMCPSAT